MNVYDFDKTIYDGDSTIDFYLFCLRKKPSLFFTCTFTQLFAALKYKLGKISKEELKEKFFVFLKRISVDDVLLSQFWSKNFSKIKTWYIEKHRPDDVVISASPEFLLKPVCEKLQVLLIATKTDVKSGKFLSLNCYGEEKVRRFRECFAEGNVEEFYTDSKSDMPMMKIAERAYLVKKDKITKYV